MYTYTRIICREHAEVFGGKQRHIDRNGDTVRSVTCSRENLRRGTVCPFVDAL